MRMGFLLVGALLFGSVGAQGALVGNWSGAIGPDSLKLGVTVHFEQNGDALGGTVDIPAQGAAGLELDIVEATDEGARFAIQGIPGEPTFDGAVMGDTLEGTFTQGGQSLPFTLTRQTEDAAPVGPPVVDALLGLWTGRIDSGEINQLAGLEFKDEGGVMTGTISFPEQSVTAPLTIQTASDTDLVVVIQSAPGNQTFTGTLLSDTLTGTFSVSGKTYETSFERAAAAASVERPQDPQGPFPYREEEVVYSSGDITLAGTLTLPQGDGPFPAMLMVTGSGPQDRDESLAGHRPFLVIADAVTRAGVAVLRVDDRGVGGSSGDLAQATYADLVGDIKAGVAFLKAHPDIDVKRVGLFGHSEGGYLAPLAVARGSDVAFVIMMAGPSVSGERVLELQNRLILGLADAPPSEIDAQISFLRDLKDTLQRGAYDETAGLVEARVAEQFAVQPENERPSADVQAQIVAAQQMNAVSPYFRSFFLYDPQPALRQLDKPVLAFYGNLDIQVPPVQSVGPLRFALRSAGNEDVTIKVFDGLNHLMQPAIRGGLEEYSQIETTIAPEVLTLITDWLKERVE